MTSRKAIGATPFALAYRMETVIPIEVRMPTTRIVMWEAESNNIDLARSNNIDLERHLDWVDEE